MRLEHHLVGGYVRYISPHIIIIIIITLGSKIGPFLWSLVYPKCSKLEVCNLQIMILDIFSIMYKSNDPQIFHLQKKLWVYKLFMRLGACFGTQYLVECTLGGLLGNGPGPLRMTNVPIKGAISSRHLASTIQILECAPLCFI